MLKNYLLLLVYIYLNEYGKKVKNSDVLNNLDQKLFHLDTAQRNELKYLIKKIFSYFSGCTK